MPVKLTDKPTDASINKGSLESASEPISFSRLWLVYFLLTIGVFGVVVGYFAVIPLAFLGRFHRASGRASEYLLRTGITFMMRTQPWFLAEIDLPLATVGMKSSQLSVSNHRSHIEAFILLSRIQGVRILAKQALFSVPFLSLFMRLTQQIPVPRGAFDAFFRAMDEVRARLAAGERVHVFPEMGRSEFGKPGLRAFSAAPFRAAILAGASVQPIAFLRTDEVWPKGRFGVSYRRPLKAMALAPLRAQDFASAEALRDEVVRRLNEVLS